jgi:hypothetical protein
MPVFSIKITCTNPSARFCVDGRDFIIATDSLLKRSGAGSIHGLATESAITAEIQAADANRVTALIDAFVQTLSRSGMKVTAVINDSVDHPLTPEHKALAATFNAAPQKLTLKYLLSLTEGHWLVSNLMSRDGRTLFAESVAPAHARRAQWERAQAAGATQRACHVFPNESECQRWQQRWQIPHP